VTASSTTLLSARPSTGGFADLGVPDVLVRTLAQSGITQPTPIQAATLRDAMSGRDVLGRARTGSGKTLAFGLPMLVRLADGSRPKNPRGLVLLPTRELAQQVELTLRPLAKRIGLRTAVVVGGTSIGAQVATLRNGVDVVIATPGRLVDLMQRRAIALDAISIAVLDEADHMADLGFLPDVTRILDATPAGRQCLLFSATLDRGVDRIVARYLANPVEHNVDEADLSVPAMTHRVFCLQHADKVDVAAEIAARGERTLFFVRTKHGADRLARQFRSRGIEAAALHGNLNQNQRRRALDAFGAGRCAVLVATDVAARGIHVDALDLVVHFDPPTDAKVYAHRSGRTARAGASGTVLSLVEPQQRKELARMHAIARVDALTSTVRPGHPAVRDLSDVSDVESAPAPQRSAEPRGNEPRSSESRSNGPRSTQPRRNQPRSASRKPGRERGGKASGHRRAATRNAVDHQFTARRDRPVA
jgi:superfamily II DNA/RNA helicase